MMSGKAKMYISLEPKETLTYVYKAIPLEVGKLKVPGIITELLGMEGKEKTFTHDSSNLRNLTILPY